MSGEWDFSFFVVGIVIVIAVIIAVAVAVMESQHRRGGGGYEGLSIYLEELRSVHEKVT